MKYRKNKLKKLKKPGDPNTRCSYKNKKKYNRKKVRISY